MKVNDITLEYLKNYLRVEYDEENSFLKDTISIAKAYIQNYTGLNEKEVEEKEDFALVLLSLCSDMYNNRYFSAEKALSENMLVKSILDMHSKNYL